MANDREDDARSSEGTPERFPVHGSFAEKLDFLMRTVYPRDRVPYTLGEIAEGSGISPGYVHALRRGRKTNPTIEAVEGLARFFKVPVAAFFDAEIAEAVARDMQLFVSLRDSDVLAVATRIAELPPEARQALAGVVEQLARSRRPRDGG